MIMEMPRTKPCIRMGHMKDTEHAYREFWALAKQIEELEPLSVYENNEFNELHSGLIYLEKALDNVERIVKKYNIQ